MSLSITILSVIFPLVDIETEQLFKKRKSEKLLSIFLKSLESDSMILNCHSFKNLPGMESLGFLSNKISSNMTKVTTI